jgi:hypothetical protein
MKKQFLFLMTGGLLALASCNNATEGGMSEAQVDSMVNARVEEIRAEMMAQNDSLINALAQVKADSIIAAMKGGKSVTTKTTTTKTTTVNPTAKPDEKPSGIKGASDKNREGGIDRIKGSSDKERQESGGLKKIKGSSDQNR